MMPKSFPKNGPLSGMIITALAALILIPLGFFYAPFAEKCNHPLSSPLQKLFFVSLILMAIHKLESFYAEEYDHCPVYLTSGEAPWATNPRKTIFLSFVPTFIGMLFFAYFAFLGPPWHLILIALWLAQGLHETHHVAKSCARKKIYPGFYSAIAFVGVMSFGVFPLWNDLVFAERGIVFTLYYALLPLILLGYYLEDRAWYQKALAVFPTLSKNKGQ